MRRKLLTLLTCMLVVGSLVACGTNSMKSEYEVSSKVVTDSIDNVDDTLEEIEQELIEEIEALPTDLIVDDENDAIEISDSWEDLEIAIDGNKITLPCRFEDFEAIGWYFPRDDYDTSGDNMILESYGYSLGGLVLENEKYPDINMHIQVANKTESDLDVEDCDIISITIDKTYGFKNADAYPNVKIAKEIEFGASEDDVKEAFGTTDDIYVSEDYNYKIFTYETDDGKQLEIQVYDNELGVSEFDLGINAYDYLK